MGPSPDATLCNTPLGSDGTKSTFFSQLPSQVHPSSNFVEVELKFSRRSSRAGPVCVVYLFIYLFIHTPIEAYKTYAGQKKTESCPRSRDAT
jgi:hypothetical protein